MGCIFQPGFSLMNFLRTDAKKAHLKGGFYGTQEWRRTARRVGVRDNFICQKCGKYCAGKMEGVADHKIPRRLRPDLAFEMSNLWWLCQHCHNTTKKLQELHADKPALDADGLNVEWRDKGGGNE